MDDSLALPQRAFKMQTRNELASTVIMSYAQRHRWIDVAIGAAGSFTPVPGAGIAGTIGSIALQAPGVFQPMVKDLAYIYATAPERITRGMRIDATCTGAVGDVGKELVSEFGQAFLFQLIQEIWPELGALTALAAIPVAGIFATAYLDARLAATLTWEVGVMTAIYCMNDDAWIDGSKEKTLTEAKKLVGKGTKIRKRVDINGIPGRVPQVEEQLVGGLVQHMHTLRESNPSITQEWLRATCKREQVPEHLVEEALRRVFLQG